MARHWSPRCREKLDAFDQENERGARAEVEKIAARIRGEDHAEAPHAEISWPSGWRSGAEAQSLHAVAVRAVDRLRGDAERAQADVNRATYAIEACVERLLIVEGEELAVQCLAAERLAATLRHRLGGLSRLWVGRGTGAAPQSIRLQHWALTVLGDIPLNDSRRQHPPAHDPSTAKLVDWQKIAAALMADAEAPLPDEED